MKNESGVKKGFGRNRDIQNFFSEVLVVRYLDVLIVLISTIRSFSREDPLRVQTRLEGSKHSETTKLTFFPRNSLVSDS